MRLDIVHDLQGQMEIRGVRYCHWKSNEHLEAAVAGETDLDVLVEPCSRGEAVSALKECGFVRAKAVWFRKYPHIEDYLGVDPSTGKLVHVHAHFRLILGESRVKSYWIPWESELLDHCSSVNSVGFPACDPNRELLLLIVRAAIKRGRAGMVLGFGGSGACKQWSDEMREFAWLKRRASKDEILRLSRSLLGVDVTVLIEDVFDIGLADSTLRALRVPMMRRLRSHRRYSTRRAVALRWIRTVFAAGAYLARRAGIAIWACRRTFAPRGLIVAILGADGCGKSTLAALLETVLGKKLDVVRLYLGSGNGSVGLLRYPAVSVVRIAKKCRKMGAVLGGRGDSQSGRWYSKPLHFVREWIVVYHAIALVIERAHRLRIADRARRRGFIVVTDRYPQGQIEGYNDGPLLGHLSNSASAIARCIGRWETRFYQHGHVPAPDLVIKLIGDPDLLHSRRPEMDLAHLVQKQNGVSHTQFSEETKVLQVDASLPVEVVCGRVMNGIWEILKSRAS